MSLIDWLISGPMPRSRCLIRKWSFKVICRLAVSWNQGDSVFALPEPLNSNRIKEAENVRTLLPFLPAKAAVGAAEAYCRVVACEY